MPVRIYTRKGDKGKTRTLYGEISKEDRLAEALGSIDELNSWIGLVRSNLRGRMGDDVDLNSELKIIQTNLLTIGSSLSGSNKRLGDREVKRLEKFIDRLTRELPQLKNFIYPMGEIQAARAVARRAERRVVEISNLRVVEGSAILKYLNRLSDALFTIARWVNFKGGIREEVWK
jgi:ATP:cob(I)alamin adenosyltransferase